MMRSGTPMRPRGHLISALQAPPAQLLLALLVPLLLLTPRASAAASACTNPGQDGPGTLSGVVNTYYSGATVSAGASAVIVTGPDVSTGGASTAIGPGDLVLLMQMQDADITSTNSSAYGGSFLGGGQTSLNGAGLYEYASVALTYLSGSTIPLTAPLTNGYRTAAATASAGQRRFQVIRVPQYSAATLSASTALTAASWNGSTGGVVAFDVGGELKWNSGTIDVTGRGFRGGAGLYLKGGDPSQPVYSPNDFAASLAPIFPVISPLGTATLGPSPGYHGTKGEGIAGTPRHVFVNDTTGAATNAAGKVFDTGTDYPGGSLARGAPGNAGGGGSDGDASTNQNQQNTGGGGGGGYSIGGTGGFGWTPNTPPGSQTGGVGGDGVPMGPGRLTMGGGGGSGSTNNGTGNPAFGLSSSGAPGGGIVLVRAKTITGSGTVNARGTSGNQGVCNDASGGGGGGGTVLLYASGNSGAVGTVVVNASGGSGGSNTGNGNGNENTTVCGAFNNSPLGPRGGGGGGFVALSSISSATILVSGASGGTTSPSATSTAPYGSSASPGGYQINSVASTDLPGATASPLCFPLITTTKTASVANTVQGGTASYTVTVSNAAGFGTATGLKITDTLPAPFTYASTSVITLSGGATRSTIPLDPTAGATAPQWGTFTVPGGAQVRISFSVNVPVATPLGTYQNPASVLYDDPTRSAAGQTVTPGGTYAGGGFVGGSNYDPNGSTAEDVTVRQPAALAKSFSPPSVNAGGTSVLSITVTNPNTADALTNAAFTDAFPGGMTAVGGAVTVSGIGCTGFSPVTLAAGALSFSQSGGTVPGNGACTFTAGVTASTAITSTNTLPAGAFTSALNVTNTAAASATLLARPTIAKSFSPVAVPTNTTSTLAFAITNPNTVALTGASFSDAFPGGLVANGGAVIVSPAGCTGFLPASVSAGAISFALTAGTLPASTTCTVSFAVRSSTAGPYVNTAGGVTTTETQVAGPASASAQLGVGVIGVNKAFSPTRIAPGGSSTVTLTLVNPAATAQTTTAPFTDTLTGMSAAGGAVTTSCTGLSPTTLAAGATSISFASGFGIPAGGCTISFAVTSASSGTKTNATSGVTTALLGAGPASNTATLVVAAAPTIAKAFAPSPVQTGQASTLAFTLVNNDSIPLTGAAFTDNLTVGLQIATTGPAGGTCPGASALSFTAGATALSFTGLVLPTGASGCTVTVPVTASALGAYPNTTGGVSSNEAPSSAASNPATLVVAATPTIAKAFATSPISQNGTSLLTFTLTNPNTIALSGAAFTDALVNMKIASPGGAAGGNCTGAATNSFATNATALSFTGLTLNPGAACTVTVTVTSSASGANANTASGVTSTQTPAAGTGSNTATLSVLFPPAVAISFSPSVILSTTALASSRSTLTFTLTNPNASALTGAAFTDAFTNFVIGTGGAAGGTCAGAAGNSFLANDTSVSFAGLTVPANGSCTVTVSVASAALSPASGWPNTTSGATSTQTPIAGAPSNTDTLTVISYATIAKSFNPTSIATGGAGTSTLTFTLTNPNSISLSSVAFSDTFPTNMLTTNVAQNYIGAGRGTCTGAIPSAGGAGAQVGLVAFSGIAMLANSSCTVTVDVTLTGGAKTVTNTSTGVTSAQTGATAGPVSNAATLSSGRLAIAKSFNPVSIGAGESSLATFVITSPLAVNATAIAFSDTLPAGMTVSSPATNVNGCNGTLTAAASAGTISLSGGTLVAGGTCTITVSVTTSAAGTFPNTTTAITFNDGGNRTGAVSNTATLTVVAKPTIAKAFSPASLDAWRNSTLTFTLTNPNATAPLTNCLFSDTLTGFFVSNPPSIGGTCVGVTPALTVGQTAISLTVPTLNPGSCTISFPVTSGAAGTYSNTAGGVKCDETKAAGAGSSPPATVTFAKLPIQFSKASSVTQATPGSAVTYTIGYVNPNPGMALQGIVISDTTPRFTSFQSASCGALPASLTSCTITAPAAGSPGTITWTLLGTLDPGAAGTVFLTVTVN